MANTRTRRLIAAEPAAKTLGAATRARRRLQEEAIKLNRGILAAQKRLVEIDAEEEIHSAVIEAAGGAIASAHAEPEPETVAKKKPTRKKATPRKKKSR